MKITTMHDYPAGLDRLWDVFGHPAYPEQKYVALGAKAVRIHRFDADAASIEVTLERVVPVDTDALPAWARPLVGDEQTLRHRSRWRRVARTRIDAELDIVPVGMPVRACGTGSIVEAGEDASRMTLAWRIDSKLPLFGGRVERLFADQVRAALDDDHRFTLRFLADRPAGRSHPR